MFSQQPEPYLPYSEQHTPYASHWALSAGDKAKPEPLDSETEADIAVIGAGYTGLSTALHSTLTGKKVVVIDANEPGWGCSGRNAGCAAPYYYNVLPSGVITKYGEERGHPMNRMMTQSADLVAGLVERHNIDCAYRRCGMLITAETKQQKEQLINTASEWSSYGAPIDEIPKQSVGDYLASDKYNYSILHRNVALLNPLAYSRGLARAAREAGADIYNHTPAMSIARHGDRWRVITPHGGVTAEQVVIGTNGYTGKLWPQLATTYYRLPMMMFASQPYMGGSKSILLKDIPFHDTGKLTFFSSYFDADQRMYGGLPPAVSQGGSIERHTRPYNRKLRRLFPDAATPQWEFLWYGYYCLTSDYLPRLYRLAPGVFSAMGYSGAGICAATAIGQQLSGLLVTGNESDCAMPVSSLKPEILPKTIPLAARYAAFPIMRQAYRFI